MSKKDIRFENIGLVFDEEKQITADSFLAAMARAVNDEMQSPPYLLIRQIGQHARNNREVVLKVLGVTA